MGSQALQRIILSSAFMMVAFTVTTAQDDREYIRKGNRLYEKKEYAGSEAMYRKANTETIQSPDASFNLGDALYKQGRYGEAASEYMKNAGRDTEPAASRADNYYNMGNALLKDKKFSESIDAYINALKINPGNMAAKYNLAYAQDQLKKQQEQEEQQQQQQNQDNKDKQDNKQDNKDQQNQQQDKNKQDQQNQDNGNDKQGQDGSSGQQPRTMSRDNAERLLDALAAGEKQTQEKVQKDKAVRAKVRVIKNW